MQTEEIYNKIDELKHEVIETRNLNIKTDNSIKSVFAEMKKITLHQKQAEKAAKIGSVAAYVIFVVLIVGGAILLSGLRASNLEEKITTLNTKIEANNSEISTLKHDIESRDAAAKQATLLLTLIDEDKKSKAVAEFRKIQQENLSKVEVRLLKEKIDIFASSLAATHYEKGVSQWRIGGYKSAVQEFERSLKYQKDTDNYGMLSYFFGLSLIQIKKSDEGIKRLKNAISSDIRKESSDKARLTIADIYIGRAAWGDALGYMKGLPLAELGYWTKVAVLNKIKFVKQKIKQQKQKEATP